MTTPGTQQRREQMQVYEFTHEDGRECIRAGRSPFWCYDGGSEKGDVCARDHDDQ